MTPIYLEDVPLDVEEVLGSYRFEAEDIVGFARAYDPQRFHLSEEGVKLGIFGGLSASGWHTAAVGMKLLVAYLETKARAGAPLMVGPSPGFDKMRWPRPVLAGDTLTYRMRPISARPAGSRPGWGLLSSVMSAQNQEGVLVFEYVSNVLMRTRPAGSPT
jgi:acyl dehydratase